MKTDIIGRNTQIRLSPTFVVLAMLFVVCLIASNLMEIKTVDLGFITITAGVIVFPISYIISDCIVEVYGLKTARMVIFLGFTMNMLVTLLLQIGIALPGSIDWYGQSAMELIFGATPRIFISSVSAFLFGSLVNAQVMHRMRHYIPAENPQQGFSTRAIISTICGEGVDSMIFFPCAFVGTLPWHVIGELILTQTILKTLYEILILPLTVKAVKQLRKHETATAYTH